MSRLKLGIVLERTGIAPRRAVQSLGKLCIDGIQIDAWGDLAPGQLGETGRREFRNLLRSANLEISALNCPLRRGLDVSEHLQPRLEYLRKSLELAYDLGAKKIVVPLPKLSEDPAAPRATILRESLIDLGSHGDRIGSVIALEAGLDAGEKVRDYLKSFDSGSLQINFDPANFLLNGFDPLSSLTALSGRIAHTHARDARLSTVSGGAREVPVGSGDIEWMMYIATLESIEYRGYLTVDRESGDNRYADVVAGVQFLRRFVVKPGM